MEEESEVDVDEIAQRVALRLRPRLLELSRENDRVKTEMNAARLQIEQLRARNRQLQDENKRLRKASITEATG
jgi:FtsZ-binding cell division protein ZapB